MLEKYNFSSDFQDQIIAALCRFPEHFIGIESVLDYKYFTGTNSQIVSETILEYSKKYGIFPTFTSLGQMALSKVKRHGDADQTNDLKEYVQKLSELQIRDIDYIRQQIVKFAQERALIIAATEVGKIVQEGKEPSYDIVQRFQNALSIGQNTRDQGYELNKEDAITVINKVLGEDYGIFTGFDLLDGIWKRGWGPGWLIVPLAPPKRYKTTFCLNLALNMVLKLGYDVIYYACEISSELALIRAYQRIANRTDDDFNNDPQEFVSALYKGLDMFAHPGRMFIKHFPSKTATINDIRAHARTLVLTKNIKPKAIFIDYAETVKPDSNDDPEYRKQANIYTSARALGSELGCAIIMPDRCNRETVDAAVPRMDSFQGAFEKAGIVDVAIGLCATRDEHHQGILRQFIFVNRHGEEGIHLQGKVDPKRMTIDITRKLEYDELAPMEQAAAEHKAMGRGRGRGGSRKGNFRQLIDEDGV